MKVSVFSFLLFLLPNVDSQIPKTINAIDCINLRDVFGNASAKFTLCAVDNSKPIKICQNCVDFYIDLIKSYENMSKVSVNSTTCLDLFVNQDRLEILNTLYKNSLDLWSRAKCYDCYLMENGTQTLNKSVTFENFQLLHNKFLNCVNNANEEDLCPSCMEKYVTLNDYFTKISDINEKISYCIDIVDVMNNSWTFWSINCCKFRKHNEYVFIGISISILVLTVVFYFVLQFCDEKKAPLIIRQTRFAESINSLRNEQVPISS